MIQRRLRVVKWLNSIPAIGLCTFCSREFRVSLSALRRTADAQTDLQEQFERHKCEREDASPTATPGTGNVFLRQEPDDEEDEEEEDNEKKDKNDDETDDGYSE